MKHGLAPRIVRIGEAPAYLGMSRNVFEEQVRPHLTIIAIGRKGKGVDRRALDRIADELFAAQAAGSPSPSSRRYRESTPSSDLRRAVSEEEISYGPRKMPGLQLRGGVWWIWKQVNGYGRIRTSTGYREGDYAKAEHVLIRRLNEINDAQRLGIRPQRVFREQVRSSWSRTRTWQRSGMLP